MNKIKKWELRKCLLNKFAVALMIILFIGKIISAIVYNANIPEGVDTDIYKEYMKTLEGKYTKEKSEYIENEIARISSLEDSQFSYVVKYDKGLISKEEFDITNVMAKYDNRFNFEINTFKKRYMKRVIGLPGEHIKIENGKVYINEKEVNIYGSQGQNRTVILTLKLSELQVIYEEIGEYPILLLDDFMSELDEKRRNSFINYIKDTQVIITCTDKMEF